jgi:2,4-dichlorophenol 6-monooxygenase
MIETDVLVVGSGPAGSSTAALLSTHGVENTLVAKYRSLSDTPRARALPKSAAQDLKAAVARILGNP